MCSATGNLKNRKTWAKGYGKKREKEGAELKDESKNKRGEERANQKEEGVAGRNQKPKGKGEGESGKRKLRNKGQYLHEEIKV